MSIPDISMEKAQARVNFVLAFLAIPGAAFARLVSPMLRALERDVEQFPIDERAVIVEMINAARMYLSEPRPAPPAAARGRAAYHEAHAFVEPEPQGPNPGEASWCATCDRHRFDDVHRRSASATESGS